MSKIIDYIKTLKKEGGVDLVEKFIEKATIAYRQFKAASIVTFLFPTNPVVLNKILDETNDSEVTKMFNSLIILENIYIKTHDPMRMWLKYAGKTSNVLGYIIPVDSTKSTSSVIKLSNGGEITQASGWKEYCKREKIENKMVYFYNGPLILSGDMIDYVEEEKNKASSSNSSIHGTKEISSKPKKQNKSNSDTILSYTQSLIRDYIKVLYNTTAKRISLNRDPFCKAVCTIMNNLSINNKDLYISCLPLLYKIPAISYFILVEPYLDGDERYIPEEYMVDIIEQPEQNLNYSTEWEKLMTNSYLLSHYQSADKSKDDIIKLQRTIRSKLKIKSGIEVIIDIINETYKICTSSNMINCTIGNDRFDFNISNDIKIYNEQYYELIKSLSKKNKFKKLQTDYLRFKLMIMWDEISKLTSLESKSSSSKAAKNIFTEVEVICREISNMVNSEIFDPLSKQLFEQTGLAFFKSEFYLYLPLSNDELTNINNISKQDLVKFGYGDESKRISSKTKITARVIMPTIYQKRKKSQKEEHDSDSYESDSD